MGSVLTPGSSERSHRCPESKANELIARFGYLATPNFHSGLKISDSIKHKEHASCLDQKNLLRQQVGAELIRI